MEENFIFEAEPFEVYSKAQDRGQSGRWIRQGRMIVVLADDTSLASEHELYEQAGATALTQSDVMSAKIDVFAQHALFRMLKGDLAANYAARSMIYAVKIGSLAGIYKEDQQVPAMRALKLGLGWWQLISVFAKGKDCACIREPKGLLPLIVFRNIVRSDPSRLDPALQEAWHTCGFPDLLPPPYVPKPFPQRPKPTVITLPPVIVEGRRPNGKTEDKQPWESNINWEEKLERHYKACWNFENANIAFCGTQLKIFEVAVAMYCGRPKSEWPQSGMIRQVLDACCVSDKERAERVDNCVFVGVHQEVTAETGLVSDIIVRTIKRRYADWKRRKGNL